MEAQARPKVLIVYYSFSHQTARVADTIADELIKRGADVTKAPVALTDKRWAARFETVPMRLPMIKIVGMLPAQLRHATGEIQMPPAAATGGYDLVFVGSPTWWFRVSLPMRSWLTSPAAKAVLSGTPFAAFTTSRRYWRQNIGDIRKMGEANGGQFVDETHFVAAGNQVTSMISWLVYMAGIHALEGKFGLPPANLKPDFEAQSRTYAARVVDQTLRQGEGSTAPAPGRSPSVGRFGSR